MKKLLIDLGNTSMKWILTEYSEIVLKGEFKHADFISNDHLKKIPIDVDTIYLASVANLQTKEKLTSFLSDKQTITINEITSKSNLCGITNAYETPENLGVDRWLACIAVKSLYPNERVCVLDVGTAITIDVIDGKGQHKGGYILPGLNAAKEVLLKNTNLELDEDNVLYQGLATNTVSAINSSYALSISALVEKQMKKEKVNKLVLTGSDADQIKNYLMGTINIEPNLVLYGLKIVSEID